MKTLGILSTLLAINLFAVETPAPKADIAEAVKQYRTYQRMTAEPKDMGANMPFPCATLGSPEFQEKSKKYGPHLGHFLHHYRNDPAMKSTEGKTWAVGAILVKEKLSSNRPLPNGTLPVAGVAGMIKRPPGTFPKSGDWEFFYAWSGNLTTTNTESCAGCHSGAAKDYVFTKFPEKTAK